MNDAAMNSEELHEVLAGARRRVRILGVVPFELDWERLLSAWSDHTARAAGLCVVVLAESDNQLFAKSFLLDSERSPRRRSFRELLFLRDEALHHLRHHATPPDWVVKVMHLDITISLIEVDDRLFAVTWLYSDVQGVEEIDASTPWGASVRAYCELMFSDVGGKYAAVKSAELLELFDHDRVPRGIFPRESFYDTDYSQLVVWALIFDRRGRMLIHRRADNAKDNMGMWDKSVGGHADFSRDVDTSRSVAREVVEELFTDETKKHTDFTAWTVSDSDIVFLGEWRPEKRHEAPFAEVRNFQREWCYFRLRESVPLYSPRALPGEGLRRLRVIADVFLFVAGPGLTDESLGTLRNSEFKLLEVVELKTAMDRALQGEEIPGFDTASAVPLFTPDLVNILTGRVRDVLEEFSAHVRRYCR